MTQDLREALAQQVEEWREDVAIDSYFGNVEAADRREQCINDIEKLLQESENE